MREFLRRKWRGVPVGVIAVLLLVGAVAAAGYVFLSGTVNVEVEEALTVAYRWPGEDWAVLSDDFSFSILGAHPGDTVDIDVRITNVGSNPLIAQAVAQITDCPDGGDGKITWSAAGSDLAGLFGGGVSIPNGSTVGRITAKVLGDAPVGNYTIALSFSRR